jgi:protein-S-isoprenylcysteine O-methyltransferase Ste14
MTQARSPWWYRFREFAFAALYFVGFVGGDALTGGNDPGLPAFVVAGRYLGERGPELLLAFATLCVIACWAIRVWGASYLRAAVVWNPDALDHRLIVAGPFRYLRDPLYLGSLLLAVGFGLLASPLGFAFIVGANAILVGMLIREEATLMRARYGATYDAYRAAVPSLVPRLGPADVPGSETVRPSLAQGLRSEIFSAAFAIAMVLLAFGGPRMLPGFYAIGIAGLVANQILRRLPAPRS